MKNKILIKTKIVLEQNGTTLVTYFWKKLFWKFGYWYPFGLCSSTNKISESRISNINDINVAGLLYDEFITQY